MGISNDDGHKHVSVSEATRQKEFREEVNQRGKGFSRIGSIRGLSLRLTERIPQQTGSVSVGRIRAKSLAGWLGTIRESFSYSAAQGARIGVFEN